MIFISILDWTGTNAADERLIHYTRLNTRGIRFNYARNYTYTPTWFSVQLVIL